MCRFVRQSLQKRELKKRSKYSIEIAPKRGIKSIPPIVDEVTVRTETVGVTDTPKVRNVVFKQDIYSPVGNLGDIA